MSSIIWTWSYLPISSTGMMTPVSLFANITVIRHVVRLTCDRTSCGTTKPLLDTGTILTSESKEREQRLLNSTCKPSLRKKNYNKTGFCVATTCTSAAVYWCFRATYCLHLQHRQDRHMQHSRKDASLLACSLLYVINSILQREVICSSEMLVYWYQAKQCHSNQNVYEKLFLNPWRWGNCSV